LSESERAIIGIAHVANQLKNDVYGISPETITKVVNNLDLNYSGNNKIKNI
jgi:Cys-tRNA synthase (O-phospho-L-seryl-tRNA:Cys-tRNA synthase)